MHSNYVVYGFCKYKIFTLLVLETSKCYAGIRGLAYLHSNSLVRPRTEDQLVPVEALGGQ